MPACAGTVVGTFCVTAAWLKCGAKISADDATGCKARMSAGPLDAEAARDVPAKDCEKLETEGGNGAFATAARVGAKNEEIPAALTLPAIPDVVEGTGMDAEADPAGVKPGTFGGVLCRLVPPINCARMDANAESPAAMLAVVVD